MPCPYITASALQPHSFARVIKVYLSSCGCLPWNICFKVRRILSALAEIAFLKSIRYHTFFSIGERGIFRKTSVFPFLVFSETQAMCVPSKAAEESSPILIPVYTSNKIAPQALSVNLVFFLQSQTKFYDFSFFQHGKRFAFFRGISFWIHTKSKMGAHFQKTKKKIHRFYVPKTSQLQKK